ncbi:hypothetical protein AOXY_G18546 [Acipenser oxyrinchus oxyrinchus]|uniref:Transmembrane protein 238 n=1 Tax=Acipenser oxyrinchus oxyrinchus TaxID=40147 RepID=A0AAD8D441_ACIOX|nr:hypothetical protein AOXY_G18546 [Acipenser oxyrinchus oxyrinchus]
MTVVLCVNHVLQHSVSWEACVIYRETPRVYKAAPVLVHLSTFSNVSHVRCSKAHLVMGSSKNMGRCVPIIVIALVCDVVGVVLLLLGIFSHFIYWDFFIYTGAIILSLSLIFWIFWYSVNLEVSYEELCLA